jgi:hypothetical protein
MGKRKGLTQAEVEALVKAGKYIAGKSDGDGLTFTLSRAGAATWALRYRWGSRAS